MPNIEKRRSEMTWNWKIIIITTFFLLMQKLTENLSLICNKLESMFIDLIMSNIILLVAHYITRYNTYFETNRIYIVLTI